jgi:hypothetical protein
MRTTLGQGDEAESVVRCVVMSAASSLQAVSARLPAIEVYAHNYVLISDIYRVITRHTEYTAS